MPIFGFLALVFGIVVISFPELIAYIVGFFFVFLGVNILAASWMLGRRQPGEQKSWKVGGYEIIRNRK